MPTIDVCDINQIFEEQRVVQSIRAFQATVSFFDPKILRQFFFRKRRLLKFFINSNAGGSVKAKGCKSDFWETVTLNELVIFRYYPQFNFNTCCLEQNF